MVATPTASASDSYIPGVCNINREEITYRKKAGWVGVAIFVVALVLFLAFGTSRWFHLLLFFPAFLAAIGFLQAKNKFCVSYGASGKQNASAGSKTASDVTEANAKKIDKARARKMNSQAAVIALVIALVTLAIPGSF